MKPLEEKLLDLVSDRIEIKEFENWFYTDKKINKSILSNDFVLSICTLDFRNKSVLTEIESILRDRLGARIYQIEIIHRLCLIISESNDQSLIYEIVRKIMKFHNWDDNYGLMDDFYKIECDISLAEDQIFNHLEVLNSISILSNEVIDKFDDKNESNRLEFLVNGVDDKFWNFMKPTRDLPQNAIKSEENKEHKDQKESTQKKWFQFWK